MQTVPQMAKDRMFKLRLDDEDRERLDMLADHYSAPAATVVRMLIKEKCESLARARSGPKEAILADEDPELYERVVSAYCRKARQEHGEAAGIMLPSKTLSTINTEGEITLRNSRQTLARYQVKGEKLFRLSTTTSTQRKYTAEDV